MSKAKLIHIVFEQDPETKRKHAVEARLTYTAAETLVDDLRLRDSTFGENIRYTIAQLPYIEE